MSHVKEAVIEMFAWIGIACFMVIAFIAMCYIWFSHPTETKPQITYDIVEGGEYWIKRDFKEGAVDLGVCIDKDKLIFQLPDCLTIEAKPRMIVGPVKKLNPIQQDQ